MSKAAMKVVETPREENEAAATTAVSNALGQEIANAPEQTRTFTGEGGTGAAEPDVITPAKSSGEIAIEQQCSKIAKESSAQLDRAAELVMGSIKQLREQLDSVETLILRGTAEAKTQISNQMELIGEASKLTAAVQTKLPIMRRLAREIVDRQ